MNQNNMPMRTHPMIDAIASRFQPPIFYLNQQSPIALIMYVCNLQQLNLFQIDDCRGLTFRETADTQHVPFSLAVK